MTLEEFAKDAGVIIFNCGEGWGGKFGYMLNDCPNLQFCGYKTEKSAYKAWFKDAFGEQTAKAVLKLLRKTQK